ncbi:Protein of unknown function [Pyronema omphalodes CBS 100304]|uniref:Uncharacterized protein n=1 Tax=Pyronema omphalodes (strain CBS 100304) TaxID=1076935 RepID=U4LRZ5_PYROM|nr:Protein of unknown function [Pyronema omphalodes CBS 100304]
MYISLSLLLRSGCTIRASSCLSLPRDSELRKPAFHGIELIE